MTRQPRLPPFRFVFWHTQYVADPWHDDDMRACSFLVQFAEGWLASKGTGCDGAPGMMMFGRTGGAVRVVSQSRLRPNSPDHLRLGWQSAMFWSFVCVTCNGLPPPQKRKKKELLEDCLPVLESLCFRLIGWPGWADCTPRRRELAVACRVSYFNARPNAPRIHNLCRAAILCWRNSNHRHSLARIRAVTQSLDGARCNQPPISFAVTISSLSSESTTLVFDPPPPTPKATGAMFFCLGLVMPLWQVKTWSMPASLFNIRIILVTLICSQKDLLFCP